MNSRSRAIALALTAVFLIPGIATASYSGDEPLQSVFHEDLPGGYLFSTGDCIYSGQMDPGSEYSASFDIDIPSDATPVFSRLYIYWAWSKLEKSAIYPELSIKCEPSRYTVEPAVRYSDSKGFVGSYDFFSGTDSCELPGIVPGRNEFAITVGNAAEDNRTFVIEGAGVLVVYESPSSPETSIWVSEGCDMLFSDYGITPEMATASAFFNGTVDTGKVARAKLELVAPSGGYTRNNVPDKNIVLFNRDDSGNLPEFLDSMISAIFPGYNGKEWIDCFDSDELRQIGTETREVGPYLREKNNVVRVRDQGDYMLFSNAILLVEKESGGI